GAQGVLGLELLFHDLAARLDGGALRRFAELGFDVREGRLDLGEDAGAGGLVFLGEVALDRRIGRLQAGQEQQDHDISTPRPPACYPLRKKGGAPCRSCRTSRNSPRSRTRTTTTTC